MISLVCPQCGCSLPIQNIIQDRKAGSARGRCIQCKIWVPILLPSIRKKLIYLDQSFLSSACLEADTRSSQSAISILSKLKELKRMQKIFVVVSDVHSRETSAIPSIYDENRKRLWEFQNDLADGSISFDWDEVFVAQWKRMIADQDEPLTFQTADIGLDDPHRIQVGIKVKPTNNWRQRLHQGAARPRELINEEIRRIFESQQKHMPNCKDAEDCLSYVRKCWCKAIREGIDSWWRQRNQYLQMDVLIKEYEAGRIPNIPPNEQPAPFSQIVGEVIMGLSLDAETALHKWIDFLEEDSANLSAFVMMRSAFEAELHWKWRTGTHPTNPDTFNKRFGLFCQNDIDHISTFVPYVDALTTDNSMRSLCEEGIVAGELIRYSCRIFSRSNYDEFEAWLDALLME